MSIPDNNYIKALLISLPTLSVVLISWLILDYVQSGSIDGILNDSDAVFWVLFVLSPAILVGLPWSILAIIGMLYLGIPIYADFIAIFISLYVNGLIVTRWLPVTSIWAIPKVIGLVFLFIPLVLAILIVSSSIGYRYL